MSYDLFMKPRIGMMKREAFVAHFSARPHYKVEGDQAWYQNEDTGAYFVFEYSEDTVSHAQDGEDTPAYPLGFNINYFRPSFFGKEAEPELSAFVRGFDLLVEDPQIDRMGIGDYDSAKFLAGWAKGNEFGYQAMLKQDRARKVFTMPGSEIERVWLWNRDRQRRQIELGEGHFVPRIIFLDIDGAARSAVVWPDAIPSLLPKADYLLVGRTKLAPRRLFRKEPDTVLLPWGDAEVIIGRHSSGSESSGFLLNYRAPPPMVADCVRGLPALAQQLQGIPADSVLDAELVARYAG